MPTGFRVSLLQAFFDMYGARIECSNLSEDSDLQRFARRFNTRNLHLDRSNNPGLTLLTDTLSLPVKKRLKHLLSVWQTEDFARQTHQFALRNFVKTTKLACLDINDHISMQFWGYLLSDMPSIALLPLGRRLDLPGMDDCQ